MWYPPPYEREIWHYQHANIDQIKYNIEQFPWETSFRNFRINEIVCLTKLSKIFSQITFPEKNLLAMIDTPWINNEIKQLIQEIINIYRSYTLSNKNAQIFEKVKYLQKQLKRLTESKKERSCLHISKKLMDPMTSAKNLLVNIEIVTKQRKKSLYTSSLSSE